MKTYFVILLCFVTFYNAFGQKTTISGKIPSMKRGILTIEQPTKRLENDDPQKPFIEKFISPTGDFVLNIDVADKEIISISIKDSLRNRKLFEQFFFITKGDKLLITENEDKLLSISGTGANNNQLKGISLFYNYGQTKQDSLPDRIATIVNQFYEKDKRIIDSVITVQKPSDDFIEFWNYHLKYARQSSLYYTYDDLNSSQKEGLKNNRQYWQNVFNSLQKEAPLSDEKALVAPSYHAYISLFLNTKYIDAYDDYLNREHEFYKEWYGGDSLKAETAMRKDFSNQLKQKIIERYFEGKVKEQMYAFLFDSMIRNKDFTNVEAIYSDFRNQYPRSKFNEYFKKPIEEAISNTERTLNKRTVFLTMKNWDEILTHFKGQTVFLDMWGSWCRPCREEISLYAADLKKQYKNKGLTFLYITNYDNEEKWKQLIAFYKLEGNHIFASEELTKEIMKKIKSTSYPSYAIIDKYGKIEKTRADSLEEKGILNVQIEEVLKR
ncbi:TlpA family protein disulfide reductase [Emticicia agri]|uniref:TlpA family protein disulfide reductase n=1 Tax=Emticicia agri TaxID=2492393 RepID=A0A4Q5LWI1_9BACT|nr:TlpA disulfide reductase family protein [Emticicia agri]RYU93929.1 TlpA family protein disulfide reductase [Emticicia agri]